MTPVNFLRDLGAFMVLLHEAPVQQKYPLRVLYMRLWPAMQHQQYEVMWHNGQPIAYVNWAWLTIDTSEMYRDTQCLLAQSQWTAGDQLWFMELIAKPGALMPLVQRISLQLGRGLQAQWHDVSVPGQVVHKTISLPSYRIADNK